MPAEEKKKEKADSEAKSINEQDQNIIAALSYLWILSVIFYVLKKDNAYIKFHAQQGMVLFGLSILGAFPVIGWPLGILSFILIVVGVVKAYSGEKYKIPLVSDIAEKIEF